jgi:hypothetical protein
VCGSRLQSGLLDSVEKETALTARIVGLASHSGRSSWRGPCSHVSKVAFHQGQHGSSVKFQYLFFLSYLNFHLAKSLVFSVINRFRGNLPWTFFRLGHLGPLQSNWKTGISWPVVCHLFLLSGSTNESSHLQTTHA